MSIKVAVLGGGGMGIKHTVRLKELGAQVVCVCGRTLEETGKYKEAVKDADITEFTDFDEMLEKEDFSVLYICLPPYAHNGQFEKAAAAGKHIFIEKPIALNTVRGKSMADAAGKYGIITRVGFHMRESGPVKKMRELIETGKAGRPVLFYGHYSCNSLHTPWWRNADLCGGQIFEQAIHIYDMCRYLLGEPKYAAGVMNNICHSHISDYTVEDVSASFAGFGNGAVASITANNCEIPGTWIGKFKVVYENVTADFSDFDQAVFTYTEEGQVRQETVNSADQDPLREEDRDFLECVEKGRATSCDIGEGYKSLLYVETVVRSAKMDGVKEAVY